MPIIQPIDSDEISVRGQLQDRILTLQDYIKGCIKARKGMPFTKQ